MKIYLSKGKVGSCCISVGDGIKYKSRIVKKLNYKASWVDIVCPI